MSLYATEEEYRAAKANLEFSEKKAKLIADIKAVKEKYNASWDEHIRNALIEQLLLNYINDADIIIAIGEYKIEHKR